ncbi:MAG: hypothetical protein OXH03_07275 [Bacteroidetes bacterium]|nr:hypothetical protein [Bacteroidota bacterium]MDE2671378.1 hypothetical protein [Bacteroidota bacterium]
MTRQIVEQRKVELDGTRRLIQDSNMAIRDIYDALVELITNADDRYQVLGIPGKIEIELIRRRAAGGSSTLRVRDFADGMSMEAMRQKIGRTGGRVSGMEQGLAVRGTNSRGAKDIAALGKVIFESIPGDGSVHACEVSEYFDFTLYKSTKVTKVERKRLGIPEGTGTVVTIELNASRRIPSPVNLKKNLRLLVPLRDIIKDSERKITLKDGARKRVVIEPPVLAGRDRLKVAFDVPGYEGARAKLTISRTSEQLERENPRFRRGGILIKSRHAVHEATLFDKDLETDPHALRFFGRLVCNHIDELWNQFDQRVEARAGDDPSNPMPVLDPSRRSGLTRSHPFVKSLFAEVLKRLRPLIEEERRIADSERATIESQATRKRLDALERAATKFLEREGAEDDVARDGSGTSRRLFQESGYSLFPKFAKIVVGQSIPCTLRVRQRAFPEIEHGATVHIEYLTEEVATDKRFVPIESHPTEDDVLQASWKLKGIKHTTASGIKVSIGPVTEECTVEVLDSRADEFKELGELCFQRSLYRIKIGGPKKRVRILAPLSLVSEPTKLNITVDNSRFKVSGNKMLVPNKNLGVARCDIRVGVSGTEDAKAIIAAKLKDEETIANLNTIQPLGAGIKIKLEDIKIANQRYRWRQNVLEIAARHPALKRYLGSAPRFQGQDEKHFRVMLAEITADAVCARLVSERVQNNPEEYDGFHWDQYYAEYSKLISRFLPTAQKLQVPSEG